MHEVYITPKNEYQLTIESRLQGWQIQVSRWTGEDWEIPYDRYAICESVFEGSMMALCESGFEPELAEWQLAEWGIECPCEDDEVH